MKLIQFTDEQLRQIVAHSLFPEHVKYYFFNVLFHNGMRLSEYVSSLFNLGYVCNYEAITPTNILGHEYDSVLLDFEQVSAQLKHSDIYLVYGIEPLDAIYRHTSDPNSYDGFTGYFYDDLFSLMGSVDPDGCIDYLNDITLVVRYLIEAVEKNYIDYSDWSYPIYVSVSSTPEYLTILVR